MTLTPQHRSIECVARATVLCINACHNERCLLGNVAGNVPRIHKLLIDDVKPTDAGDYTFVPDGYALSLSAKLNFLGEGDARAETCSTDRMRCKILIRLIVILFSPEIKIEYVPKEGKLF